MAFRKPFPYDVEQDNGHNEAACKDVKSLDIGTEHPEYAPKEKYDASDAKDSSAGNDKYLHGDLEKACQKCTDYL